MTMLVNSARRSRTFGADASLATQDSVFRWTASPVWRRGLAADGDGVTLDELSRLAIESLRAFGVVPRLVQTTHVPAVTPLALEELRSALAMNEASGHDWIILNFLAATYVGTGDYGHFAPVGAYDAARARVLVLDPDRETYEPYWVPDTIALAGMATPDAVTGQPRGYLYLSIAPPSGTQHGNGVR